jgi:hypothetical protein
VATTSVRKIMVLLDNLDKGAYYKIQSIVLFIVLFTFRLDRCEHTVKCLLCMYVACGTDYQISTVHSTKSRLSNGYVALFYFSIFMRIFSADYTYIAEYFDATSN